MRPSRSLPRAPRAARLCLLLSAVSCGVDGPKAPGDRGATPLEPGPPVAGMAEAFLQLPVGAPLGGYTGRCECFGGNNIRNEELDQRDSAYTTSFVPSYGIQTRPHVVALWLENGSQAVVMMKTDAIYAYEGLVRGIEERLSIETGADMRGKVMLAASHTHAAPANYDQGLTWFLGGDRYNHEIYERIVEQLSDVALEAWAAREPAALGVGLATDWDPDDRVYRDRRDQNDALTFFPDIPAGRYKDPYLSLLRVDTADGRPLGFFYGFGIHGTVEGERNPLWSNEAGGHTEYALMERFDQPVAIGMWQHGGGDASPAGVDDSFARMESLGDLAADAIYALWEATPTTSGPIHLESVARAIPTSRETIRVTRDGTVDWYYAPYDETAVPDEKIYEADGSIASPIDEFNTRYGGAFCGEEDPLIPGFGIGSTTFPYSSCVDVEAITAVIGAFFGLENPTLPMPESEWAEVGASRMGPLPIREPDGSIVEDDVLWAFFPGETTAMFTEWFRRRAADELGYAHAIPVGYAQDHEGYLLIPEDWLTGGYEPNINIWGPLQGEHIMEGLLDLAADHLESTDVAEPLDPFGDYPGSQYPAASLEPHAPDSTPAAGTFPAAAPEALWTPLEGLPPQVQPDPVLARVSGVAQLTWEGGDPSVDDPRVSLERRAEDGSWAAVTTEAGRPITEALPDILLVHLPDPLYPYAEPQSHTWWASWQVVGHVVDRAGVPEGTYRLRVEGRTSADAGEATWPWASAPYEVISDEFDVVPATLQLGWDGATLSAALAAPPWGYRLVHLAGSSRGLNPVLEPALTWTLADGGAVDEAPASREESGQTLMSVTPPEGAVSVTVTDRYGNTATLAL